MNWNSCVEQLAEDLTVEQLNTWIKPLQVEESEQSVQLFAPILTEYNLYIQSLAVVPATWNCEWDLSWLGKRLHQSGLMM